MAPEQMTDQKYSFKVCGNKLDRKITQRAPLAQSDVFSFGVLLYEIYAREQPWANKTPIAAAGLVMQGRVSRSRR